MTSLHPRTQLQTCKICFIGGGNMGVAMIAGLLHKKNGVASPDPQNISVSEPWEVNRRKLEESDALSGIRVETSNVEAARGADVLLLAVKPQVAEGVCRELAASWSRDQKGGRGDGVKLPLIVSIAGGITMDTLIRWFTIGDGELRVPRIVRVMPNTPALVGEGASASFAGPGISKDDEELVTELLQSFSKVTTWVKKEELMDVVTGISGSGPAYFFLLVEHMVSHATSLGLSLEQAQQLAAQTCLGAGLMLVQSPDSPAQLRRNVTSPNGTTEAALKSFHASRFQDVVNHAIDAAVKRAGELGREAAAGHDSTG